MPLAFSFSIDPPRCVVLRETCLYRIAEIAESTYEAFEKDRLIVAFSLSRAFMETEALFWSFIDELENSIQTRNIDKIRQFLSKCMVGVKNTVLKQFKSPENISLILDPINVLNCIDKMEKQVTHYRLQYDSLSERAHPNAAGTVDAYATVDWEAKIVRFGKNKSKLAPELALPQLVASLKGFLRGYDYSASLLEQFTPLCEELLEKSPSTNTNPENNL